MTGIPFFFARFTIMPVLLRMLLSLSYTATKKQFLL